MNGPHADHERWRQDTVGEELHIPSYAHRIARPILFLVIELSQCIRNLTWYLN
jgi:hypothetical protein